MRDEMDARLWNTHHEAFSNDLAAAGRTVANGVRRLNRAVPTPLKLVAGLLALSFAAITAPPPAFAAQPTASVEVAYSDLDLASEAGRRTLNARIEGAARQLCQPGVIGALKERQDRRACYRAAVASAETQVEIALASATTRGRAVIAAAR